MELAEDWRFHDLRRGVPPRRPLSRFPELPCLPCAVIFAAWDPTWLNRGPRTAPATAKG